MLEREWCQRRWRVFASHPAPQASDQKQYFILLFFCCRLHLDKARVVRHQSPSLFFYRHQPSSRLCVRLWFQVQRRLQSQTGLLVVQWLRFSLKRSASGAAINAALHSRANNTIRGGRARSEPIRSERRLAAGARRRSHGGPFCHGY